MGTLIHDYCKYQKQYELIYEKAIVLHQTGSFYEIYGYTINNILYGAPVNTICDILAIQMTRRNKNIIEVSYNNPNMAGLPVYTVQKYIDILTSNNYTVILVSQVTLPPNVKREVTRIISPTTNIHETGDNNHLDSINNYIACLYLCTMDKEHIIIGSYCYIDLNNSNQIYTFECSHEDTQLNLEDLYKTIISSCPRELIIITDQDSKKYETVIKEMNTFVLSLPVKLIHNKIKDIIHNDFFKLSYQTSILNKIYSNSCGLLSVIEYLDLERYPFSIISLCYLIQYIYELDKKIIEGITKKPIILYTDKYD